MHISMLSHHITSSISRWCLSVHPYQCLERVGYEYHCHPGWSMHPFPLILIFSQNAHISHFIRLSPLPSGSRGSPHQPPFNIHHNTSKNVIPFQNRINKCNLSHSPTPPDCFISPLISVSFSNGHLTPPNHSLFNIFDRFVASTTFTNICPCYWWNQIWNSFIFVQSHYPHPFASCLPSLMWVSYSRTTHPSCLHLHRQAPLSIEYTSSHIICELCWLCLNHL